MSIGGTQDVAERIWVRLPEIVARRFFSIGVALSDGGWTRVWGSTAVIAPAVAFGAGLVLGTFRADPIYSHSLVVLVILLSIAAVGAAFGAYAWFGYVIADFVFHGPRTDIFGRQVSPLVRFWRLDVPLFLTYAVLFLVLVMVPVVASGLRVSTIRIFRLSASTRAVAGALLQGLFAGIGVLLWAHAAAFLVRPLWSFVRSAPDVASIRPLQHHATLLAWMTGLIAAARVVVEAAANNRQPALRRPRLSDVRARWPWWVATPIRAGALTLLAAGMVKNGAQGWLVFAVVAAACAVRALVVPRLSGYVHVIGSVPMVVRLIAVGVFATFLSDRIVHRALRRSQESFVSVLVVLLVSVLAGAFLLPPVAGRRRAEQDLALHTDTPRGDSVGAPLPPPTVPTSQDPPP